MKKRSTALTIVDLTELELLVQHWDRLKECQSQLDKPFRARTDTTPAQLLQSLTKISAQVAWDPAYGCVLGLVTRRQKLMGFLTAINFPLPGEPLTLLVTAAYSDPLCSTGLDTLRTELESWARLHDYAQVVTFSRRVTSPAKAFFTKKLGFTQTSYFFSKSL